MIHPVILCGGSGTRLWPASRAAYPKQFAPLVGRESLYQATLRRLSGEGFGAPLVMTSDAFRFLATDQAHALGLDDARVVVEPAGRDTAPAILTAALMHDDPEALLLIAPSDHLIPDVAAFRRHAPDLFAPCEASIESGAEDLGFFRLGQPYAEARAISVDYAVMEPASQAGEAALVVVPLESAWTDLGSWDALWQLAARDADGVAAEGPVTAIDCRDSYLRAEEGSIRLVGLGLERIVAVAMRDAVLVADMGSAQKVKAAVATLRAADVAQADEYPRHHRPWGWYETLCIDHRFQVKRIMVHPGGVLSLQSHMHRSEHWVVVAGTAEITIGEETRLVTENQSVYIPLGSRHRMANPGRLPMYLIEVQTGSYLGEEDIVRHEDVYGRG